MPGPTCQCPRAVPSPSIPCPSRWPPTPRRPRPIALPCSPVRLHSVHALPPPTESPDLIELHPLLLPPPRGRAHQDPPPHFHLRRFKTEPAPPRGELLFCPLSLHIESATQDPSCIPFASHPNPTIRAPPSVMNSEPPPPLRPLGELHPPELIVINQPPRLTSCRPPVLQNPSSTAGDHRSSLTAAEHRH
jgi:hypothetical protein